MKRVKVVICMAILLSMFVPASLYAIQTNFQFSPPPIPWYEFNEGDKDLKVGGTLIYLNGDIKDQTNPQIAGSVDIYGGGGSGFWRYAFRKHFAFDIGASAFYAAGNMGKSIDMTLGMFSVPFDLEFQPVHNDKISIIFFGGFILSWMNLGIDYNDGVDKQTIDISSNMKGPQGGVQVAFKQANFVFTPFLMFAQLAGDTTIDTSGTMGDFSGSFSVSGATAYFYGIDIVYLPWDITLSSLIQQVSSSGDNKGYKTYVFTVSYHFSTPAGEKKEEDKKPEGETNKKAAEKAYNPAEDTE